MMALLETAIKDTLLADTTIATLTKNAIRPLIGDQLDARPFITYQITGTENKPTNAGPSLFSTSMVEFGIYGDSVADVVTLSDSLKRIFSMQKVSISQIVVGVSIIQDESDIDSALIPGKGTPVYVRVQTYKMMWRKQ
jgi:hypothetical protein